MNTYNFILQENVLTDNILSVPENGYIFKFGYIAQIKEYIYSNSWSDKELIKNFKSKKQLFKYLDKKYPDVDIDFSGTILEN